MRKATGTTGLHRKKILLAVDGSNQSLEAVRYASRVFPAQKTRIVLFSILSKIPEFFYDLGEKPKFREETKIMQGWEKGLKDSIDGFMSEARQIFIRAGVPNEAIRVEIHERQVGIARDIIRKSCAGYDLVIVGRNGLNNFGEFVLGSVVSKLIEKVAHVSICVVGGKPSPEKILVAVDESENAMRAVDYVGAMLSKSANGVTLFHAVRGFDIYRRRYQGTLNLKHEEEALQADKMGSVFEKGKSSLVAAGFDRGRVTSKLAKGVSSRAGAILEEAREGEYGTIVVGRRGLSTVYEFLMGRVSNKVIQMAKDQAVWVVP